MKFPLTCAALSLSLLVVACSSGSPAVTPPTSVRCAALGTHVLSTLSVPSLTSPVTPAVNWNAPHTSGKVLITSTGELSAQNLQTLQGLNVTSITPNVRQVQTPAGKTDQVFAQELASKGLKVQPDFLYQPLSVTNDPGFPGNAGLKVNGVSFTQTYLTRTRVPEAWDVLTKCNLPLNGALTAVVDSAVDTTHPELQGRITANISQVTSADGAHVYEHGTAAAGIIGATGNNSRGITGIGQAQPLLLEEVITSEGASTSSVTKALYDAVKRGAKVINISLGISTNPGDKALDQALTTTASSAVLVAAAGNSPGGTPENVYYPASHPDVIAVGATGVSDAALAWYSARPSAPDKRALDIVAPGGEGAAPLLALAPQNSYDTLMGTSFAAPQVAGVAALMRAANPSLSASQTRALLLSHVNAATGLPLLDAAAAVTGAITLK